MASTRRASDDALPDRRRQQRSPVAAVATALLIAIGLASTASAQTVALPRNASGGDVELDVANETLDQFAPSHLATLGAALWNADGRSAEAAEASVNRFETGHLLLYGAAHAALDVQHDARWRAAVQGDVGGGAYRGQPTAGYVQVSLLGEHTSSDATRIWAASAVGHAGGSYQYGTMHVAAGASLTRAGVTLSGAAKAAYASSTYADFTSQLAWRTPLRVAGAPVSLTLDAGARSGRNDPHQSWSSISAVVPLMATATLDATYGVVPSDPELAMIGARTATIGVHIGFAHRRGDAPSALEPLGPDVRIGAPRRGTDRRVLVVRVPNATTVEIMGDFTGWTPVALTRASATEWRVELLLTVGAHRANMRVNGGDWRPLPGTPAMSDDFGGSSSLLVVQ